MNIFEPTNFVVYAELIYGNMKLFLKPTSFLAMMLCYWKLLKIIKKLLFTTTVLLRSLPNRSNRILIFYQFIKVNTIFNVAMFIEIFFL